MKAIIVSEDGVKILYKCNEFFIGAEVHNGINLLMSTILGNGKEHKEKINLISANDIKEYDITSLLIYLDNKVFPRIKAQNLIDIEQIKKEIKSIVSLFQINKSAMVIKCQ